MARLYKPKHRRKFVQGGSPLRHEWTYLEHQRKGSGVRLTVWTCPCGLQKFRWLYEASKTAKTLYSRHDMSGHTKVAGHCTRTVTTVGAKNDG